MVTESLNIFKVSPC